MEAMLSKLKNKSPSKYSFLIFLIITACSFFGRSLFELFLDFGSRQTLKYIIFGLGSICFLILAKRIGWKACCLLLLLFAAADYFFASEELIHIFFFGALGASLFRDGQMKNSIPIMFSVGVLIAIWDEILQGLLPWRVGDIRDVALNIASVCVGWSLSLLMNRRSKSAS